MLTNGFEVLKHFISEEDINTILQNIESINISANTGGIRNIDKKSSAVSNYIQSSNLSAKASAYLCGPAKLVRAIFFNKTAENNWRVSWHQDKNSSSLKTI